jgi:hypothetical protein
MSNALTRPNEVVELVLANVPTELDAGTEMDVVFIDPAGANRRVPAFASQGSWRVRYSSPIVGRHHYEIIAADSHTLRRGEVEIVASDMSEPSCPLPLRVAAGQRRLEHIDGSPFLWLADTWWEGFTSRISIAEFRELAARRADQGFSVVQIVAGLYPEMAPFAPGGASESGWAWREGFAEPNPSWFDEADQRVTTLIDHGIVPCIVGAWGYYLQYMTDDQMLRHWREVIARWGAHPVVWCLAGEMPGVGPEPMSAAAADLQGAPDPRQLLRLVSRKVASRLRKPIRSRHLGFPDSRAITEMLGLGALATDQVSRWNRIARAVRSMEPFGRPITVHSMPNWPPYEFIENPDVIDLWLLQTGHSAIYSLAPSVDQVLDARDHTPRKPVIVGEVCYEGILGSSWHEIQRFLFWSHLLSGTAGHTYGAQGLWGFNTADYPGGTGGRWNGLTWHEATNLPGATHVGIGRKILLELPWEHFEPHPEWVEPHHRPRHRLQPYAAGIPGGPRLLYFPTPGLVPNSLGFQIVRLHNLGHHTWHAQHINPRTGHYEPTFLIHPDPTGTATLTGDNGAPLPTKEDWLLLLQPQANDPTERHPQGPRHDWDRPH